MLEPSTPSASLGIVTTCSISQFSIATIAVTILVVLAIGKRSRMFSPPSTTLEPASITMRDEPVCAETFLHPTVIFNNIIMNNAVIKNNLTANFTFSLLL